MPEELPQSEQERKEAALIKRIDDLVARFAIADETEEIDGTILRYRVGVVDVVPSGHVYFDQIRFRRNFYSPGDQSWQREDDLSVALGVKGNDDSICELYVDPEGYLTLNVLSEDVRDEKREFEAAERLLAWLEAELAIADEAAPPSLNTVPKGKALGSRALAL